MDSDLRGIWMGRLFRRLDHFDELWSGFASRLIASLWGVRLGNGCRFFGIMRFRRAEFSSITIGDNCTFRSSVGSNLVGINRPCMISTLTGDAVIMVGSGCGLSGTVIGAAQRIEIGNNVLFGANSTITDTDWHGIAPDKRREPGAAAPVIIGDNVWIGLNATVLKGVTIGKNSIIGAGSVVAKSIPANVIASGQPARIIKSL